MTTLANIELFKDLPKEAMEVASRYFEEKSYKKGETVYLEGDSAQFMWFVKSGRVNAAKTLPNGFALTVCRVESGCMFGMCCDFKTKIYACQTTAATDAVVVRVPIKPFMAIVEKYPGVASGLLGALARRLGDAQHMRSLTQESVEKRIVEVLLSLHKEHGTTLPFTRKAIAEMVGTTVETAIRVLSGFQKKGIIRSVRGVITMVKLADLQKISQAL